MSVAKVSLECDWCETKESFTAEQMEELGRTEWLVVSPPWPDGYEEDEHRAFCSRECLAAWL